jgi:hypothetical protein
MIGNDIVDLADPETSFGACHPRFDHRVFAPAELAWLGKTRSRVRMRWILWSAKEAAYKAARQACSTLVFSPSRFVVSLDRMLNGSVRYGDRCWNVRIQLDGDCVHAVVTTPKFHSDAIWGVRRLAAGKSLDPSAEVRKFATAEIATRLDLAVSQLRIVCSDRVPRLVVGDRQPLADLSLSHHGSFVGFACQIGTPQRALH